MAGLCRCLTAQKNEEAYSLPALPANGQIKKDLSSTTMALILFHAVKGNVY